MMTFRYPKIKLAYDLAAVIQSWIFPIFFVFILKANDDSTFWITLKISLILILIAGLFIRLIETLFTRVEFLNEGVHVYTGVFSKNERFIPKEKFENIQTSSTIIHTLFGAAQATMETGDAEGDIKLAYVPKSLLPALESYILTNGNNLDETMGQQTVSPLRTQLFMPSANDLLKASLTSFSFLAILPVVYSAWNEWNIGKWLPFDVFALPLPWLIILAVCFAVIAMAFGVFKTFNAYYYYEISMDDERIYVKKGWLAKHSFSIRKEKVQAVIYKQTIYQRLLKVTTIRLISTGEINSSEDQQINEFFPYLPSAKANELVAQMLPRFTLQQPQHRVSEKAKALIFLRPPVLSIMVLMGAYWQDFFYALAVVTLLMTYLSRYLRYKHLSFSINATHLQITSGAFVLETVVTERPKLIEMEVRSSPLQRRFGVITIRMANRAKPIQISEIQDIDKKFQDIFLNWFEGRKNDVRYVEARFAAGPPEITK